MRGFTWVRAGLVYLAASAAYVGVWALAAPKSFYDDFPGMGMNWGAASGPYNEHYVRDTGAFYVGFVVLFLWALVQYSPLLVRAVAGAWVVVQVPHLVFHLSHKEGLSDSEWLVQAAGLVSYVVVGALLVWLVSGRRGSPAR